MFSKIIAGDIPSYRVAEDNDFFAFLDISPVAWGHTLVVPKKEIDYIFDLDDALLAKMILFSKRVAAAIEQIVSCKRVGITVMGLEVPHAHIHLIPMKNEGDMYFNKQRPQFTHDELFGLSQSIAKAFK